MKRDAQHIISRKHLLSHRRTSTRKHWQISQQTPLPSRARQPRSKPLPYRSCTCVHKHWQIPSKPLLAVSRKSAARQPLVAQSDTSNAFLARRTTQVNIELYVRRLDFIHSAVSSSTICLRLPQQDCLSWTAVLLIEST